MVNQIFQWNINKVILKGEKGLLLTLSIDAKVREFELFALDKELIRWQKGW